MGRSMIEPEIYRAIGNKIRWKGHGVTRGRVTNAQGGYMIDNTLLRILDVAYSTYLAKIEDSLPKLNDGFIVEDLLLRHSWCGNRYASWRQFET
jgi:hypothetical protein